jgi:ribosomal protein S18
MFAKISLNSTHSPAVGQVGKGHSFQNITLKKPGYWIPSARLFCSETAGKGKPTYKLVPPTWEQLRAIPKQPTFYWKDIEKAVFEDGRKRNSSDLIGNMGALDKIEEGKYIIRADLTGSDEKTLLEEQLKIYNDPISILRKRTSEMREISEEVYKTMKLEEQEKFTKGPPIGNTSRKWTEEELAAKEEFRSYVGVDGGFAEEMLPEYTPALPPNITRPNEKPIVPYCYFCKALNEDKRKNGKRGLLKYHIFNPMNVPLLTYFIAGNGNILPRKFTGNCARHQRKVSKVIKKAVNMGFFSWKRSNFRINSPFELPNHLKFGNQEAVDPLTAHQPEPEEEGEQSVTLETEAKAPEAEL